MGNQSNDTNIRLNARAWREQDEEHAGRPFIRAGFENTQEIMDLRIYDMLNICGIDRIMAEEMMYALYRFFNEDKQADDALYSGFLDQYFDYAAWRKAHPEPSQVLVKDIIMADGMNMEALCWLFGRIVSRFWRSPEYSRNYRYWNYKELIDQKEGEQEK